MGKKRRCIDCGDPLKHYQKDRCYYCYAAFIFKEAMNKLDIKIAKNGVVKND